MPNKQFKVFISFSGWRSQLVAEALRESLLELLPKLRSCLSVMDISKGSVWYRLLSEELQATTFAIVCLTPDNLSAPWIHFEAGAVSKHFDSHVCTYLLGVSAEDLDTPLGTFQHTLANRDDTHRLVLQINKELKGNGSSIKVLERKFDKLWPKLDSKLTEAFEREDPDHPVASFWTPHHGGQRGRKARETLLFYTEPRFYRRKRLFVRSLDDNDADDGKGQTKETWPELGEAVCKRDFRKVHQFVSAGEARCLVRLAQLLTHLGVRVKFDVSHRRCSWASVRNQDLVIIGNARTHWAVRELQKSRLKKLDFVIKQRHITLQNRRENEKAKYPDDPPEREHRKVHAIVTRCRAEDPDYTITMLAANNGRAFEAVAEYITNEESLCKLLRWASPKLPPEFQLLFEIALQEDDSPVTNNARLVTTRPWGPVDSTYK